MKNFTLKIVNGKQEEWPKIALLLSVGFFSGIFLATYEVIPTVAFIKYFDEKQSLPYAFTTSGVLGVLFTYLFSLMQKKMSYKTLVFYAMLFATVFVISLTIAIKIITNKWIVFIIYVMHTPISSIVVLIFWGMFGRLFDFQASKRLASGIDTGQALSAIIGFFTIPLAKNWLGEETNFMIVSSVCILINLTLFIIILNNFSLKIASSSSERKTPKKNLRQPLVRKEYVMLMGFFITLSLSAAHLVHYSFLSVTGEFFQVNQSDNDRLLDYLSFFNGAVMICSFLVQTFLNDKIIEIYGLKIALMFIPGILCIFTFIAIFVGYVFGYTYASNVFLFFFLMISVSKLFVDALKDSLETPTLKIFFFPIDASIRFDIQTRIEGVVSEAATLIVGLLLILSTRTNFFDLIYNSYIIIGITLLWMYTTANMYEEYKKALKNTLENSNYKKTSDEKNKLSLVGQINKEINKNGRQGQVKMMILLDKVDFFAWYEKIGELNKFSSHKVKEYIIRQINSRSLIALKDKIDLALTDSSLPNELNILAKQVREKLINDKKNTTDYHKITRLCISRNADERIRGIRLLSMNKTPHTFELLLPLLRDLSPKVRRTAFITTGKLNIESFIPILIEHLGISGYENTAFRVLLHFGEKILPTLETAFHKNAQNAKIQQGIIHIYGSISTPKATELLKKKVGTPNRQIFYETVRSLDRTGGKISKEDKILVKAALREQISNGIWALAASTEIEKTPDNESLSNAIKQEILEKYDKVFLLLSLLHEKESVMLVKQNIRTGTPDSIGYALELLSVFIDEDLKAVVLPFLDNSPASEKVRKYEIYFPRESLNNREVLLHIISRDYTSINRWTKACAIYAYAMRDDSNVNYDLIAHLFNEDKLLRETSAWAICKLDATRYEKVTKRVDTAVLTDLNKTVLIAAKMHSESALKLLRFYKIKFLLSIDFFKKIPGAIIVKLIESLTEIYVCKGQNLLPSKNTEIEEIYVIVTGSILLQHGGQTHRVLAKKEIIHDTLFPENQFTNQVEWIAQEDSLLYKFNEQEFFSLVDSYTEVFEIILDRSKEKS